MTYEADQNPEETHETGPSPNSNYGTPLILFNLALFVLVGGVLGYLRFGGDPYVPASPNILNLALTGGGWLVSFILFVFFVVRAHQATRLQNIGAVLFFAALAEIVLFSWLTYAVFTSSRENAREDRLANFIITTKEIQSQLPLKLDSHATLTSLSFGPGSLLYTYAVDGEFTSGEAWQSNITQSGLKAAACALFAAYLKNYILMAVTYSFDTGTSDKTMVTVPLKDCAAANAVPG